MVREDLEGHRAKGRGGPCVVSIDGPAKSVVKHLAPDDFDSNNGLSKLLAVLRNSPLQTLPIPDSFSKLERWHHLRRKENETIPELIVREDDLFRDLQASLLRSRARVTRVLSQDRRAPSSTPASPSSAKDPAQGDETETPQPAQEDGDAGAEPSRREEGTKGLGFFEDELPWL